MNNDEVKERAKAYPQVKMNYTTTTGKIDAINKGLEFIDPAYDVLILVADDVEFTVKGFDWEIEYAMLKYAPDFDIVLHYPDQIASSGKNQITLPVIGREFVKRFGFIYPREFKSVWADNWQLYMAKKLKKYKYIDKHLYNHLHPIWLKEPYDELMQKNESFYNHD